MNQRFNRLRSYAAGLFGLLVVSLCLFNPAAASVPLVGLSGRAWNAGVFNNNGTAASVAAFASWRGKPVDSVLFFATRDSWTNMMSISSDVMSFPGIKVIAIPPFPESLGTAGLAQTAAGNYNSWWTSYGQMLVNNGLNNNRTVIRLGWELNGNWYVWSATTGNETNFINAWRNVVNSIRAGGATAVQFDWCVNKGNQSNTNAWAAYPGDAYVDILGLDIYDFWDPSFTDTDFNNQAAKVPSLNDISAYCSAHGKQMALDEWAVAHDAHGGNDNPFFIQKIWDWLGAHTGIMAYETTYDDPGAPSTLHHKLSPPEGPSWNPNAGALYQSLWGSGTVSAPAAPTGLNATAGNAQVALAWTASSGAATYNVYRGTSPGGESTTAVATGVTSVTYTDTGLTNGTYYYYKVKAVNSAGTSGYSNEASAMPVAVSQPIPNGTYALTPANATGLRLDVAGAGTADGTNVDLVTAGTATNQQWIFTNVSGSVYRISPVHAPGECLDVNGQSTADGANIQIWQYLGQQNQQWSLSPSGSGYLLIPQHATGMRLNAAGTTSGSNVTQATANSSTAQTWLITSVGAPAAPAGLAAVAGDSEVDLAWSTSSGATSYNVYRGTTPGGESGTPVATGVTATTYTDTGLTNGTTYYYKVAAVGTGGTSGYSSEASAMPVASSQPIANGTYTLAPANAPGLRLDVAGAGTANGTNVDLVTASGATNQQWIFTNVSGSVYRVSPAHASAQCLDVNGQSAADGTNIQIWQYLAQQNQQWAVSAVSGGYVLIPQHATGMRLNAAGTTTGSNVTQATANSSTAQTWTITPITAPAAPTGLAATAGNAQVALSWTASSGATSYNVYRGTSSGGESATPVATGVTGTSYTNTGLTNGTAYYFKVAAVGSGGTSGYSNEAGATPVAASGNTHGGTWAAKGVIPTTATWVALYQQATCAQNTTYVAKVWVKGSGSFIIKTLNSSWVQIAQTTFTATSTWTEQTITFTTPNTASPGVIFYVADAGGGGTLYIDDCFMGVSGGTNVLANPGFESGSALWTVGSSVWTVLQNP